jgi:quercetin dioxygenase-like cupin family protein
MNSLCTILANLNEEIVLPDDGTLSRTVHHDDHLKAVLFGFATGQELSEHTASMPAVMHFLSGEADVTLGSDSLRASGGTWIQMPPQMPHRIRALSPVVMLLLLLKQGELKT